jgi:hypothetical protein
MYAARMAAEAEARGDLAKARFWLRIKAEVDLAPAFDQATKDRLRILLAAPAPAPAQKRPAA